MTVGDKEIKVQGRLIRIARVDGDKYEVLHDPETICDGLRKSKRRVDLFTFMQILPKTTPKYSYFMEWDNFAALPISTFDHWWTKQVDAKTRNMVRKAEKKGLEVREVLFDDTLVQGISEIYNECPIRQGRRFPHYGKSADDIRKEEGTFPGSSLFIGAFLEGKLVGFVKLVHDETRSQAGLMNIISMVQHRDKAPTNGLLAQAVRSCADRGIPYLVYSNFSYGKKQGDSLSDFKRNNGFQQIDLPRYFVPLNLVGKLVLRLRLHHGLSDYIPESVAAKLREFRKAWYGRRFQAATEA
jgi:hypothetical protein